MASATKIGTSDPISYTCTCNHPGSVLLFYRYFANSPPLPSSHHTQLSNLSDLATFHRTLGQAHSLTGKIRISTEGFNITIAGPQSGIDAYLQACMAHWSFSGLGLDDEEREQRFFKPTPGCACVFTSLSVRVTAEITPLGVTDYSPSTWSAVRSLLPQEFHRKCVEERVKLVDVRNHYESRIGYFVDGGGEEAVKPQVRRFSQWPQWVKEHCQELVSEDENESQQLLTYCTGGIRCEKGVRWMEEYLSTSEGHSTSQRPIYTLQGGIAAYLTWMEEEIATGRKTKEESLFKGQNYVFDARGSIGISDSEPVSECHVCKIKSARFGKCASEGCHLVLVVCEECEKGDVRCCSSCKENEELRKKAICECEQEREKQLWGGERVKEERTQGWRKKKRTLATATLQNEFTKGLDIRLKLAG